MEDSSDQLGGEGSIEDRFDRLTDDQGKPILDKAIRKPTREKSSKETARERRYRKRLERIKKEEDSRKNRNEYWYKDPNIVIKVPDGEYDKLTQALQENRAKLEDLKRYYCRAKRRQHPIITESYLQEIRRHVLAIEGIKDKMAAQGLSYRVYYTDRESPSEACERIIFDCFVASCIYGPDAVETEILRLYRDVRLSSHPIGRLFIKIYYSFAGQLIAKVLHRSAFLHSWARYLLDIFVSRISRIV